MMNTTMIHMHQTQTVHVLGFQISHVAPPTSPDLPSPGFCGWPEKVPDQSDTTEKRNKGAILPTKPMKKA